MTRSIAYLGPAGNFTESAALAYGGEGVPLVPMTSLPAIVTAVETGAAAIGVLPIENSLEGAVPATLDLLIHESDLRISGELVLPIRHMLVAREGVQIQDVRVLHANSMALGQCRRFVERCLPSVDTVAALSNAAALLDALKDERPAAAIAPMRAVEIYGGTMLARDIQDNNNNQTRFIALSPEDAAPTGDDKTSLCFALRHNHAGALVEALHILAEANINMDKLESRPAKELLGQYIFLVDIEGHRLDPQVAATLQRLDEASGLFKIFGSYPRFRA